jgi:transcriptional regulator with XRE-family HTH domain
MTKVTFDAKDKDAVARRKDLGKWLKALRNSKEWTQLEAAQKLGYEWFTFISQIEGGHARIPTEAWETWANAYGVDVGDFSLRVLKAYDPALLKIVKHIKQS